MQRSFSFVESIMGGSLKRLCGGAFCLDGVEDGKLEASPLSPASTERDGKVYKVMCWAKPFWFHSISISQILGMIILGHSDCQCPLIATENAYAGQLEEVNYWARSNWKFVCLPFCFLVNTLYCVPRSGCAGQDETENLIWINQNGK